MIEGGAEADLRRTRYPTARVDAGPAGVNATERGHVLLRSVAVGKSDGRHLGAKYFAGADYLTTPVDAVPRAVSADIVENVHRSIVVQKREVIRETGDLAARIDAVPAAERAATGRFNVLHRAVAVQERVKRRVSLDVRVAGYLATRVDALAGAVRPAERAQILHRAIAIAKCVSMGISWGAGSASHLTAGVDALPGAGRTAEGSKIGQRVLGRVRRLRCTR